jgi:hypothetical protein
MSVEQIDNALVTQFSGEVHVAAQQMKARLRGKVKLKAISGENFAYDGLGPIEAAEIVGRHQPVNFSDINHLRRKLSRRRFTLTLPIDAADVRGVLINPSSEYAAACARAMERVFDRVVIEAMFASVLTGRDFGTTVTFASEGSTVTATAGLTYEKLLEINQNFIDEEVGTDVPESLLMGISGDEHTDLMQELELTSGDYSRQFSVDKGRMQMAAGLDLIHFGGAVNSPLLSVSSGTRSCFAMSNRAMCVGISKDISVKIESRADLVETTQVQLVFDLGAVRTEGVLIQKVTTTD